MNTGEPEKGNFNLGKNQIRSTKNRLAWRLEEIAKATGLSVQFLRKEIRAEHLEYRKFGRCVVILDDELQRYLRGNN